MKCNPFEQALFIGAAPLVGIATLRGFRRGDLFITTLSITIFVVFAAAMSSKIDIGICHILIVFPLLSIIFWCALWRSLRRSVYLRFTVSILFVVGQSGCTYYTKPRLLSYLSPFTGGPSQGPNYLVDSNSDWGQDLALLPEVMHNHG